MELLLCMPLSWEDSRHFAATPLLVSPRNYVWETRAEIPYWWCVSTQVLVVLLIGWKFLQPIRSTTQIGLVTRHQYEISAFVSQTSSGGVAKCQLFSQATLLQSSLITWIPFMTSSGCPVQWNNKSWSSQMFEMCFVTNSNTDYPNKSTSKVGDWFWRFRNEQASKCILAW